MLRARSSVLSARTREYVYAKCDLIGLKQTKPEATVEELSHGAGRPVRDLIRAANIGGP